MHRLCVALLVLTACTSTSSPAARVTPSSSPVQSSTPHSTSASPAPSPPASPVLAVFYNDNTGFLSMINSNGMPVASVVTTTPHRYSGGLPWTSSTLKRLYYITLSGDVRFLLPDGTTAAATHITLGQDQDAGFAVSPDDRSVAVAVLSYGTPPPGGGAPAYRGMRMYVEDVVGGGHHVEIFSSPTVTEFPIAWTGGRLIIAVSQPVISGRTPINVWCCHLYPVNPYFARAFHVADPATGRRFNDLCDVGVGPIGPIEPVGVMCWQPYLGNGFFHWDGSTFAQPGAVPEPLEHLLALSPDGTRVAIGGHGTMYLETLNGPVDGVGGGFVIGWLDRSHVVYLEDPNSEDRVLSGRFGIANVDAKFVGFVSGDGGSLDYLGPYPTAVS